MVSEETEIPCSQILSGKKKDMETVDARYLLVHFLSETGFSPSYIASKTGITERTVTCMQNSIAALQAITKTYIPSSNVCQSDCCGCVSAQ